MDKWILKYMKLAKTLAEDNTACYSRKIGVFIANKDGSPVSMGYNGTVSGCSHNDTSEHLDFLWDIMFDEKDKVNLLNKGISDKYDFIDTYKDCKTCPRKILDIPSGERLDLCNCSHAERNAIFNAAKNGISIKDTIMYCWCGTPCHECTIAICQSGIKEVVCLDRPLYSKSSEYIFKDVGVKLTKIKEEDVQ